MDKLSVVIITYNEERNIGRCLESVKDVADEVVVIDSFSTDRTEEICVSYGARFIPHSWEGYVETKNFANAQAKYNRILSLDADEALSEPLKAAVKNCKWELPAYEMSRLTNYCGHWIRHCGWYPDRKIRLFDRREGHWAGLKIHEKFELHRSQKPGLLEGDLLHYSYYTISDHVAQANHFTDITAQVAFEKGKRAPLWKLFVNPIVKLLRDYLLKRGFLDGYYGFVVCQISANATFLKYLKLRQLHQNAKHASSKNRN